VHHKNSNKGWDRSITYALPADINPLLVYMVTHGQQLLQGQGRVFCLPGGGAMTKCVTLPIHHTQQLAAPPQKVNVTVNV
jgi:hypothetical protein